VRVAITSSWREDIPPERLYDDFYVRGVQRLEDYEIGIQSRNTAHSGQINGTGRAVPRVILRATAKITPAALKQALKDHPEIGDTLKTHAPERIFVLA
jgi:hypothetical protein